MSTPSTIVVAGAGAIGRTIAYVLARAEHTVIVVDPDPAGGNASRVAAGMLAPSFEALFDKAPFGLLREALDLWRPLAREIGLPLWWEGAMSIGDKAEAEAQLGALLEIGVDAELRDLGGGFWGAYSDMDQQLDPELALELLQYAAQRRHRARYVTGRVTGFSGGVVQVEGSEPIPADKLVIATGADRGLQALAPELEALTPIKGHLLRAPGPYAGVPAIRAPGIYLCRTERGSIIGASMENGRDDTGVDPTVVEDLLTRASALSDGLRRLTWTPAVGVRAATPDGLPMVGEGRTPGAILAVGARRNGWLLAPLIAEVVLEAVEGRPKGRHAQIFEPDRFG